MFEPTPAADAPEKTIYLILGSLQFSEACLRTYGHPALLRVAAANQRRGFRAVQRGFVYQTTGSRRLVAWHQDGVTHWQSPQLDGGTHGFNFMAQLYGSTAANGLWIVPGTHNSANRHQSQSRRGGYRSAADAVPMIAAPGDVGICNRQTLHGSFANASSDTRVTVNFGFHRRASVLGVTAGGVHNARATYDAARISERSRVIGYAIDARRQRFPDETPYVYLPIKVRTASFVGATEPAPP